MGSHFRSASSDKLEEDHMIAVILAGGHGTRISEETTVRPKPMVEVGERPIIWHIMKIYSASGINDFIVCCGYKGSVIKDYFSRYYLMKSDVTIDIRNHPILRGKTIIRSFKGGTRL